MNHINVFIVDDSQIHLEGLKMILNRDESLHIIGEAHNIQEVRQAMSELHPDVMLLDICLEKEYDGIEITKELTPLYPNTRIIILSHNKDKYSIVNSIRSGARAFLAKDTSTEELIQAIHTVYHGKGLFLGETIPRDTLCECFGNVTDSPLAKPYNLSEREIEIIEYLAQGYATKQIAEILSITTSTVDSHKEHIKEKLQLNTAIEIVVFCIKNKIIAVD